MMSNENIKIGDRVWICDYRYNNILEKPIRHIEPQEVLIVSNNELPSNKRVYYSVIHFRPIGKTGKPLKQIISPYDNTGFRAYTGISLQIFETKEACIQYYLKQCQAIKQQIAAEKEAVEKRFNQMEEMMNEEIARLKKS